MKRGDEAFIYLKVRLTWRHYVGKYADPNILIMGSQNCSNAP